MQVEHGPQLALGYVFIIGIAEEGQHRAVHTGRWLDDVGDNMLVGLFIKVGHLPAAVFGVLPQIVIAAVGDALQLRPAHGEIVVDVVTFLGVMRQFFLAVGTQAQVILPDAETQIPPASLLEPVVEPFICRLRPDEVLDFHLLELPAAEDEVAGGNLVAERFPELGDAERQTFPRRVEHVLKIDEDTLRGLRPQVDHVSVLLHRPHKGLEHQVEQARLGELTAAGGASAAGGLVAAPPQMAVFALHQRVGELLEVSAGRPRLRVHQDAGIQPHHVIALLDHGAPPGLLNVALQFHAQRPVVPAA